MIPIPTVVYNSITFPLQLLASRVSTQALDLMQIPVLREGNVLELAEQKLSVVEACSGIRSLLSLTFLALVYGYFFERKVWIRVTLFLATIPIAIVANASRVTLTGVLTEYKPELAEGFFHTVSGWVIFMVALAILIGLHQILNRGYRLLRGGDRQMTWLRNKYVAVLNLVCWPRRHFFMPHRAAKDARGSAARFISGADRRLARVAELSGGAGDPRSA